MSRETKELQTPEELEKRVKTLETVSRVGTIISSRLNLKELTGAVVDHLGKVLKNDRVNLVLFHSEDDTLEFIASFISGEMDRRESVIYPVSDGMNSWIIRNRKPLLIRDGTVEECERLGIRHGGKPALSWLGVPMILDERIIGVLSVQQYREPNTYDDYSVEMLQLVAGQVAVAVENARLYENMAKREEEKKRLYFSLAHDLLGFMNPINGFAEIIQRMEAEELAEKKKEIGDDLKNCTDKVTRFVEDLLVISKIESGKLELNLHPANIYQIIGESISNFRGEIEMRNLEITVDGVKTDSPAEVLPVKIVLCDIAQAERVVNNIVQNGIRHAATRLEFATSERHGFLYCSIRDDGKGLEKELSEKVFDEYFQAEGGKKGVGLGLPSVKSLVQKHGGTVKVDTDKGKGFTFTFSLPMAEGV